MISLHLSGLVGESTVDGPGLRMTIFTQGCPHHCPGCHNPATHPQEGGITYTIPDLLSLYRENPILSGITFSGGEPFLQARALAVLASQVHRMGGDIVTYTGYTLEQLLDLIATTSEVGWLLAETDLLIDGPFVLAKASMELPFRGSSNQRLLYKKDFAAQLAQRWTHW